MTLLSSCASESAVPDPGTIYPVFAVAFATAATPAVAHGGGIEILFVAVAGLIVGAAPGIWFGSRGQELSRGNPWLAGVVGIQAIVGVTMYTIGGGSGELFSRVVMLPFTLLIAIAGVALLIGFPMYAAYVLAHRLSTHLSNKRSRSAL